LSSLRLAEPVSRWSVSAGGILLIHAGPSMGCWKEFQAGCKRYNGTQNSGVLSIVPGSTFACLFNRM
jgi:hypothetical protein